ncbi:hypothetical protein Vretimale_2185 [Volvox reticuliferus]|uniref:Uncharacterized protein n=1 Tax=Volvox reticuliferus TaxID=1737510 RepID=A0A8J4C708_9CHLO|nr:hypothetical protein Vretifemale_4489 [Volvox reticuliferus]GIL96330.1 hypothetical protein Vretimale_2185 [Volvox reticuliferus]
MLSVVVLISTLLFLFVQVPQGAGLLLEVLRYASENVDKSLEQELRVIIEVSSLASRSSTINSADLAGLAKHVCAARCNTTFNQTMANSKDSFERFWSLTEDPGLAIATRRSVLACIILHWILQKERKFDDHAEKDLENITRWFYNVHLHSVAQRGLLEYLHISKSGGTSFSEAAALNDCSMAPGIGQVEELGDLPRWINGTAFEEVTGGIDIMWSYYSTEGRSPKVRSCRERSAYLHSLKYDYVSNEFTMHGGGTNMVETHVCPQTVNVVTLRDPDSRLISHVHYILARIQKRLGKLKASNDDDDDGEDDNGGEGFGGTVGGRGGSGEDISQSEMFRSLFCQGNITMWEQMAPTVVDNYITRSFIGERAFHTSVGSIGLHHLDVARRVLLHFDLVLDMDAGSDATDFVLRQGLGWSVNMSQIHARSSWSVYSKLNYNASECQNDGLLRELQARQGPDRQLYRFGRALAFLDFLHLVMAHKLGLQPVLDISSFRRVASAGFYSRALSESGGGGGSGSGGGRVSGGGCGLIGAIQVKKRHLHKR